ncbi:MAG: hypothetical protein ACREFT_14285, partial [Acetobacteraceae bacterium]
VLNKADLLGGVGVLAASGPGPKEGPTETPGAIVVSALTGEGLAALRTAIDARLAAGLEEADYALKPEDGAGLAWLYRHGEVIARNDAADAVHVTVRLTPALRARFEERDVWA